MKKFTLKAGLVFLSQAFQFIIVEKCNIQIIFGNVNTTFVYAITQLLSSHSCSYILNRIIPCYTAYSAYNSAY